MVDGTKFVDRFIDCTRVQLVFDKRRVARKDIKSMSIYRAPAYVWLAPRQGTVNLELAAEFPNQCPHVDFTQVLCSQPLNGNGECPEHGKVRMRPREKLEDEDENKVEPALRSYKKPTQRGKIMNRRRRWQTSPHEP